MEVWYDGDLSECYYAEGHVDKDEFIKAVNAQELEFANDPIDIVPEQVEHIWVSWMNDERFYIVDESNKTKIAMTRFIP